MSTEKQKDGRTLGCVIWMKNIVRNSTSVHTFPVTCMLLRISGRDYNYICAWQQLLLHGNVSML